MRPRTFAASLALIALALIGNASRGQHPQQAGAINFIELFQALDANDDKVITRGEVPEAGREAFDRLAKLADTNNDGKIDAQEYRGALARARESAMSAVPRSAEAFKAADTNGDGKLQRSEWTGLPGMFARIDADGDGALTLDEVTKFRDAPPGAGAAANLPSGDQFPPRFQAMDKNGDKQLTREEFTGVPANFDRMDADKNGMVTPAEIRKFIQANAAKKAQEAK